MKKRLLSLMLVLCMVLPMIPLSTIAAALATPGVVNGLSYDSPFAKDVYFTSGMPLDHWYTGLAGDAYETNFNNGTHNAATDYATYMTAFDMMAGFGDIAIDAGTVVSNGFDGEEWYNDLSTDVVNAMNTTSTKFGSYVTREITGKAHKWNKDIPENGGETTRATEYLYAYYLDPTKEAYYDGPTNLPKMIINAGNQSDEKGAIYGLYYLINDILNNWDKDPVLEYLRHNVILVVIPCQTPGGINQNNTYWNANNVNINRNYSQGFVQTGGYDFVEDPNGEWVASTNADGKLIYVKAEDGNGTHKPVVKIDGIFSSDGSTIGTANMRFSQNSGLAPFDQAEACAQRDLFHRNADAFYYVDYHTNTSGPYEQYKNGQPQWNKINWLSIGTQPDEYCRKLLAAADWHLDRVSENLYKTYNLAQFGCAEGTMLGYTTQTDSTNGSTRAYARSMGILAMAIEGCSGFPKSAEYPAGILGGRYSPLSQKACSEILGNWLMAILGEYGTNGNMPYNGGYTTTFNSDMSGNYPTIGNLTLNKSGAPDTSTFPATVNGATSYPLSALKDSNGNELYPLTFNGNWQIGYKALEADGTFGSNADNFTPYSVYAINNSSGGKTLWFTGDTSMYGTTGALRISTTPNGAQTISSTTSTSSGGVYTSVSWKNDVTIRYTAEYDGKITISAKDLLFAYANKELTILKNGVEIGYVKADELCSSTVFDSTGAGTATSVSTGVGIAGFFETTVKAGDHIDFVNHYTEDEFTLTTDNYAKGKEAARRGLTNFRLKITYQSIVTATDIEADYSGKTDALNWTTTTKNWESFLTWYNTNGTETTDDDTVVASGGTLLPETGTTYAKINQDLIDAKWIKAGDTWEDAIEGYFDYLRSLSSVSSPSGWIPGALEGDDPFMDKSGTNFSPVTRYHIFHQRCNLFSVDTGDVYATRYQNYKMAVSENYFEELLNNLRKAASLLPESENGKVASEIVIPYDASFATTLPVKENGYAICPPDYNTFISAAAAYIEFGSATSIGVPDDCKGTLIRVANKSVAAVSYTVPSGMKTGMATLQLTNLYHSTNYQNAYNVSIYLVRGGVETEIIASTTVNPKDFATTLATINETLATPFPVQAGDRIDVRFSQISGRTYVSPAIELDMEITAQDSIPMHRVQYVNGGNVLSSQLAEVGTSIADLINAYRATDADFAANGCYINGVWYSADAELPAIGNYDIVIDDFKVSVYSSIGIGATYAMNAYLPTVDGATAAGVKVNGEKIPATLTDGMYKATVATVYAKDLLDAKAFITPYYVMGDKEVEGQGMTLRAADMLKTYIGGGYYTEEVETLAQSALDYATVAKAYFAGETAEAETLARLAAYDTAINGETAGKLNKTGDTYTFTAATLQIGETINFVIAIGNKDGSALTSLPAGTTLAIADKVEVTEFVATSVNGQKVLAAVIEGVPEKEFAAQQTFELKDAGNNVLARMTYGVKDYCVRAFGSAAAAEANMIRAVYAIGKAAAAYDVSVNGDAGETEKVSLDGKKVIFCGNSHIYWGRAVIGGSGNDLSKRNNDQGTFYQLCKAFGQNVNVTNWTFGSHGLSESFGPDACGGVGGCKSVNDGAGEIHEQYLTDRWYDYVIISPGSRYTDSGADFLEDIQYLVDFFTNEEKGGNPNVKFVCVGNMSPYGYSNLKEDLRVLVANNYKVLEEDGFIISDWGSIVYDVLQKGAVDGGNATYTDSTFVVKDGFHPNMLSGYINALTTFCAITGESPVGMPFPSELLTAENHAKLDIDTYIADTTNNYLDPSDTNMKEILTNDAEMLAIQKMIARYLEAKPYRDFNFE